MNAMGKELMAKRITKAIKHTFKVHDKTPIFLKWKEDTNKDKQDPGEATIGIKEGRDPTENQNECVQAEKGNSRQQGTETVVTATRRNRKIPATRRDDFCGQPPSKSRQNRKGGEHQRVKSGFTK
jgi:hypothetical protein